MGEVEVKGHLGEEMEGKVKREEERVAEVVRALPEEGTVEAEGKGAKGVGMVKAVARVRRRLVQ